MDEGDPKVETAPVDEKPVNQESGYDLVERKALLEVFANQGIKLSHDLQAMLLEAPDYQGGRKGCGFTTASREISQIVDGKEGRARSRVFDGSFTSELNLACFNAAQDALDAGKLPDEVAADRYERELVAAKLAEMRTNLEPSIEAIKDEPMRMMGRMILDCISPYTPKESDIVLNGDQDKDTAGTCTTSEIYFLDATVAQEKRHGSGYNGETKYFNTIQGPDGEPLGIEKIGMGNVNVLTLKEVVWKGLRMPAGSLFAMHRPKDEGGKSQIVGELSGAGSTRIIPAADYTFTPLRLSTLSVNHADRARIFGKQLEDQKNFEYANCDTAELSHVRDAALLLSRGKAI